MNGFTRSVPLSLELYGPLWTMSGFVTVVRVESSFFVVVFRNFCRIKLTKLRIQYSLQDTVLTSE